MILSSFKVGIVGNGDGDQANRCLNIPVRYIRAKFPSSTTWVLADIFHHGLNETLRIFLGSNSENFYGGTRSMPRQWVYTLGDAAPRVIIDKNYYDMTVLAFGAVWYPHEDLVRGDGVLMNAINDPPLITRHKVSPPEASSRDILRNRLMRDIELNQHLLSALDLMYRKDDV